MSFWGELRRRKVVKVAVAYAIVGWLLLQVVDVVLPTFNAPEWVGQTITLVLILGFPIVFIIAWAFEITPEGIKKSHTIPLEESITHMTGQKLNYIVTLLSAARRSSVTLSSPGNEIPSRYFACERNLAITRTWDRSTTPQRRLPSRATELNRQRRAP